MIQQNNTIDLYELYFEGVGTQTNIEPPSCKTKCVLRDPVASNEIGQVKRAATGLSWHPDDHSKLAVAYSIQQFQQMPEKMSVASYIWDIEKPNNPIQEILPPSPLCSLMFNPRTADHIVGGCYNGLVSFFDLRKGSAPVEVSVAEQSHHDPVYDVFWIQSRTGNECCSVSTDGSLLWWDIRKLSKGPMDRMMLTTNSDVPFGGTRMEYKMDAGATKYLVGTEQGQVLLCDRKAKKDKNSDKSVKQVFGEKGGGHYGPIFSVQRNPHQNLLKYFLTAGDWTARVWNEDLRTPIMTTPYDSAYLTSACWSPSRPGLFYTTKVDGTLDAWDMFFRHSAPAFSTRVSKDALCSLKLQSTGATAAVGDVTGSVTVLELSASLSVQQKSDKARMSEILERETKRERNIETISRKKESQEQKRKDDGRDMMLIDEEDSAEMLELLRVSEEEFFRNYDSAAAPGYSGTSASTSTSSGASGFGSSSKGATVAREGLEDGEAEEEGKS